MRFWQVTIGASSIGVVAEKASTAIVLATKVFEKRNLDVPKDEIQGMITSIELVDRIDAIEGISL